MPSNIMRHAALPPAVSLLLGCVTLFGPTPGAAQTNAFLPEPGKVVVAASHTLESYDEFWVGETEVSDPGLGRVETASTSIWIQAGLCRNVALVAQLAYVDVRTDGAAGMRDDGLGDRSFELQYRFVDAWRQGWRHSLVVSAGGRFPASGYDPNGPIALGDGTNDALFKLTYQVQVDYLRGAYLAVQGGYESRSDDAPNGSSFRTELGATFDRLSLAAGLGWTFADGGSDIMQPGFTFPGLKEETFRVGGSAYYRVSPIVGFAFSAFTTPDGRNTGHARGASTTLVVRI